MNAWQQSGWLTKSFTPPWHLIRRRAFVHIESLCFSTMHVLEDFVGSGVGLADKQTRRPSFFFFFLCSADTCRLSVPQQRSWEASNAVIHLWHVEQRMWISNRCEMFSRLFGSELSKGLKHIMAHKWWLGKNVAIGYLFCITTIWYRQANDTFNRSCDTSRRVRRKWRIFWDANTERITFH